MFILQFCKKYWPILTILFLEILLFATNYIPNTYFLGWDNLFPEINFFENIRRNIFGVWLEYRGLGLLDGMSFAANLEHHFFLSALAFFLPQNLLRYFFIFLMHFLGGLGFYFLLNDLFKEHSKKKTISLIGSLFYLFNLVTVQTFFAPYEVFAVHYAFLPLLLLGATRYLRYGSSKNILLFSFISLLSVPQAHVPTIFIVYIFALACILYFQIIGIGKTLLIERKEAIKRSAVIFLITFIINSYWGLPYFYSAIHNSKTIANSKINTMSTEDVYLRNKAFGNFTSVTLLKGFSLDYVDFQPSGQNDYMMGIWREYVNKPIFIFVGLLFFVLAVLGLIATIHKRNRKFYPFAVLFIFAFLMLGTDIPILGALSEFFNTYIPYFFQIFRFTFTKFSILYAFSFSILLVLGLSIILDKFRKIKYLEIVTAIVFSIFLGYYSFPVWNGNFLYKNLKVNIPQDYFELVDFFKTQNINSRIALLPQPSYWGWTYNNWGYKGSGFIWYGLSQASLDGAFYPWSRENENYYWELTQAIYSKDKNLFEKILEKYQISWLLLDKNILQPSSPKSLYTDQLEEMIKQSGKFENPISFGKIKIYKVNLETKPMDFVFLTMDLPEVGPTYTWNNSDKAYEDYGNYISKNNETMKQLNNAIYYPFPSLFTGRKQEELEFSVEDDRDYFSFKSKIPKDLTGYILQIPKFYENEISEIDENDFSKITYKYPQLLLDGELVNIDFAKLDGNNIDLSYIKSGNLEMRVPKINGYYSFNSERSENLFNKEPKNCDQFSQGIFKHDKINESGKNFLRLTSVGSSNCIDFDLPHLSQNIGFLVTVESRNIKGKSLLFSIINKNSQRADLETNLPKGQSTINKSYFVIPPIEQYGLGYSLYFDNKSYGREETINDLGKITVNPIPYRLLTSLKIVNQNFNNQQSTINNQQLLSVSHPNPSFYEIRINNETMKQSNNQVLILSQSFDSGWHAYEITNDWLTDSWYMKLLIPLFGTELKNHVLVNNWENGWQIPQSANNNHQSTIAIIYLPQYLEYLGFTIFLASILFVLLKSNKNLRKEVVNNE